MILVNIKPQYLPQPKQGATASLGPKGLHSLPKDLLRLILDLSEGDKPREGKLSPLALTSKKYLNFSTRYFWRKKLGQRIGMPSPLLSSAEQFKKGLVQKFGEKNQCVRVIVASFPNASQNQIERILYSSMQLWRATFPKWFLAQNPRLVNRFNDWYTRMHNVQLREVRLKPPFLNKRDHWLKALGRLCFQGQEKDYCWVIGLPPNFRWQDFLSQNDSLSGRYDQEQLQRGRIRSNTPNFYGNKVGWIQVMARRSMSGKEGYCWVEGLPDNFNWKHALTPSVKKQYMEEQLGRTKKAYMSRKNTENPAEYLTEDDFAKDGTLRPRHKSWLGKQALWVQNFWVQEKQRLKRLTL